LAGSRALSTATEVMPVALPVMIEASRTSAGLALLVRRRRVLRPNLRSAVGAKRSVRLTEGRAPTTFWHLNRFYHGRARCYRSRVRLSL